MRTQPRASYHHGDLQRALVDVALELARAGGPEAVVLREASRRLQVSPAAVYRHFPDREALLAAVAREARSRLAARMLDEVERVADGNAMVRAIRRFQAVGQAYLDFAADEPNLLGVAFLPVGHPGGAEEDPSPWHLLAGALDDLVATGAMPASRRPGAELICWSAVHGFAVLREGGAFAVSGDPQPDSSRVLDGIARALQVWGA